MPSRRGLPAIPNSFSFEAGFVFGNYGAASLFAENSQLLYQYRYGDYNSLWMREDMFVCVTFQSGMESATIDGVLMALNLILREK